MCVGGEGMQWESDLNKILLLSSVGPPGVLLEGGDDRGRRRAQTLHCTVCMCVCVFVCVYVCVCVCVCLYRSCDNCHGAL